MEKLAPGSAVYISCHPETMARDLGVLKQMYRVERTQPFDMFPFAEHAAFCAQLRRRYRTYVAVYCRRHHGVG